MNQSSSLHFRTDFWKRVLAFLAFSFAGYFIVGVISIFLSGSVSATALRLAILAQDLLIFIFPAIATAVFITPQPEKFLCIDTMPKATTVMLAVIALVASVPAMNFVVDWNNSLTLPDSLKRIEEIMRAMEESAQGTINTIMGDRSNPANLILSVILIGVMAGVSEELIFRGTIQRLLTTKPINPHIAIWATAILFSVIHLQFFGFFPRVLLGAFFGYLLWWSGSVWLPVMIHALNNSIVVVAEFRQSSEAINTFGTGATFPECILPIASALVVAVLLFLIRKSTRNQMPPTSHS